MKPKTSRRPFVFMNVAISADGKIAPASRRFTPFGSRHDQTLLLRLRTEADAVMAGARTLDLGPVTLGPGGPAWRRMRRLKGRAEYNLRVIVSGSGSISPEAEIFRHRHSPIVLLTTGRIRPAALKQLLPLVDEVMICGAERIDFRQALRGLREKWCVRTLLCEGGGELNAALFHAGLVDELYVTVCPLILGGRDAPTLADGCGVEHLAEATGLRLVSRRRIGSELFLRFRTIPGVIRPRRLHSCVR